jgi:hypothetical protein
VKTFSQALGAGIPLTRGNQQPMVDYLKANGFPNAQAAGVDSIDFGDGNGPIDVLQANGSIWFQNGQDRFGASPAAGGAGGGGSLSLAGGGGGGMSLSPVAGSDGSLSVQGPGAGAVSTPGTASSTRDLLLQQLGLDAGPTNSTDPTLNGAITAYDTQSQRDQQLNRNALAERAYASGNLDTGGFNTAVQQSLEDAAGKRASFAGNLTYQEAQNKRQTLTQLLQMSTAAGLTQQAQDIQRQIADIDAQLRSAGLGFNYDQLLSQNNRDAMLAALG